MRALLAGLLALVLTGPVHAQTAEEVHAAERTRFRFGELRPGANGDASSPRAANTDESKAGNYVLPSLFENAADRTPEGWQARRAELARLVEDHWVGRVPEVVQQFEIVWRKEEVARDARSVTEQWIGQVVASDGRTGPAVDAKITFPRSETPAPALISYSYIWPGGRVPDFGGSPPPDPVEQALEHGFAHVEYRPQLLQADTAADMHKGIIGLARWPREKTDWGALRVWAWGASRLREELARDRRINGKRISLTGHSRFGKGVLVAAAFDHAFADAHVSSSGAGGAKIMRRDFGERWENMAGSGAFHWFTPNIMTYSAGETTTADLPIDAHTLIALRSPRPLFVTSGLAENGDSWVDPRGMWLATDAAQPGWALHGVETPDGEMPQPESEAQASYPLGWYQHGEGHVPWPAYDEFYKHETTFAGR